MSGTRYCPVCQTQLNPADPHGNVNCSAYALAMAIDGATLGGCKVTGILVRALSSEPVPDPASPGLNIPQLVVVSKKLHVPIYDNSGEDFAALVNNIRNANRYAIVQGDADQLPTQQRCVDFNGPHAITVVSMTDTTALILNPLCRVPRTIPRTALRRYAEKLGADTGLHNGGIRYAVTRPTPRIAA